MARQLIDLSMRVHNDMVVFPRVVRPSMAMYESWTEFATRIGAAKYGADWLTATSTHIGHGDLLMRIRLVILSLHRPFCPASFLQKHRRDSGIHALWT